MHIHVKDEVSMTTYMDLEYIHRIYVEYIKENYQNTCHLKTTKSESLNI